MSIIVDARGLSCPQPIIMTQKAIAHGSLPIEVTVDTVTSRENVRRMVEQKGYKVEIIHQGDEFKMVITK